MSVASPTQPTDEQETVDLAALGRAYTPPQVADTSPEVSDVIAEMPWWASRGLVYLIIAFIIAALLWAHFSVVDITVEARGAFVPEGYVKPVQAIGGGVVQAVFVREGEQVERGQALVQFQNSCCVGAASRSELTADALHRTKGAIIGMGDHYSLTEQKRMYYYVNSNSEQSEC